MSTVKHIRNQKDAPMYGMIRENCHAVVVAVNATKPHLLCAVDANWPTVKKIYSNTYAMVHLVCII